MTDRTATDIVAALLPPGTEPTVLAVIWATVDTERVLGGLGLPSVELPDDRLLGASVRLARPPAGEPIAVLEPRTEGRIAATLAREGEGQAGRYVLATDGLGNVAERAAAQGIVLSRRESGPFGASVLVAGGPVAGPHLVIVERPPGTIET